MADTIVLMNYDVLVNNRMSYSPCIELGTKDSYGLEQIKIIRGEGWTELEVLAVFHTPGGAAIKKTVGADGVLEVPPEATAGLAGQGKIVFVGLAEDKQRITADLAYSIRDHSGIDGDNPGTPTPDVVQQILENSNNAVRVAQAAKDAAENAHRAAEDAAIKAGEEAGGASASAKRAEDAAKTAGDAATKVINEGVAEKLTEMQGIQEDVKTRQQDVTEKQADVSTDLGAVTAYADAKAHGYTGTREEFATLLANAGNNLAEANAAKAAAQASATQAGQSANAAAASAKAAASAVGATFYGVEFTGSTSAGTRTGAAAEFVFTPGTDTSAGQNDFDGVYPWAGMRRCCCTLNADGTVTVNAYKGQPGYIEDGTNGEVLVEVPLFYVSGMLDVNPRVSAVPMPGFRAPRKFQNADGSLKQKCYLPAFPGSIGADGKLHSIAGVVSTGNKTISQFLAAARLWGETYCINTSADFEVLAYLMIVVYGTRNVQAKMRGVSNLYATGIAVTGALTSEAAVIVAKGALEVGNVISIGTGGVGETVASRRIVTAIEAIEGDTANVKAVFTGDAVATTTDHKVWRIMEATGTANSVISTCGSPVSNTDGKHSFVFYGVENPLYGNQWRMECDWKLIDGVPYYCDDPTKYQWSSANDYIKLDTLTLPGEGWAKNLQADERVPQLQITKEVGGSSSTYLADYFYINKSGTRIVLRGSSSNLGDPVGAFSVHLSGDASLSWWYSSADLSIPG